MAGLLYRTATTLYPCCIPTLGKFKGAGRIIPAAAKVIF